MAHVERCRRLLGGRSAWRKRHAGLSKTLMAEWLPLSQGQCQQRAAGRLLKLRKPGGQLGEPSKVRGLKGRMIVAMRDANYISERLCGLKQELSDIRIENALYWSRNTHTELEKAGRALNQQRVLRIKRELSDLMKRCA
jgi:hypothetical protein